LLRCGTPQTFASTQEKQAHLEPVRAAWVAVGVVVAGAGWVHALFGNKIGNGQEPRVSRDFARTVFYFTLTAMRYRQENPGVFRLTFSTGNTGSNT
jgi:hypothetical protein